MSEFGKFIENQSYGNEADSFVHRPQMIGGTRTDPINARTGALLQENGDIRFHLYEPEADRIEIDWIAGHDTRKMQLEKNVEGFFDGILAYDPDEPMLHGKRTFRMTIDGVRTVYPKIPMIFRGHEVINYVDIPDPSWDEYLIKDVPHGTLSYRLYYSDTTRSTHRCMVYLPAEYNHTDRDYPVLYLHHGWGENETTWMFAAKVPQIMDNLIASGEAEPFIVVTNENMPKLPSDGTHGMGGYEKLLLNDCIPFLQHEYRIKDGKWSRGIAGNSYGCMITSFLGFGHPESFGVLGLISGGIRCRDIWPRYEQNHHLDWLKADSKKADESYRLIYRSHGTVEYRDSPDHEQDDEFLNEYGIVDCKGYVREFFDGGRHEWDTFGRGFAGFARYAFKD